MCGYGHALTFKDLDDSDIASVQEFIRNKTLSIISKDLNESIGEHEECDVLLTDDLLEEYFGSLYKRNTNQFEFRTGDIKLIKQIKIYVEKTIAKDGMKAFISKRQQSKRKAINKSLNNKQQKIDDLTSVQGTFDPDTISALTSDLFTKIIECCKSYNVNEFVDLENVDPSIVSVSVNKGQIYGHVCCVICQSDVNKKNQKPKKISYHSRDRSQYWVTSNFTTHLKIAHKLRQTDTQHNEENIPTASEIATKDVGENAIAPNDAPAIIANEYDNTNDASVIITNDEALVKPNLSTDQLYEQFSHQITTMTATLYTTTPKENMQIKLAENDFRTVNVSIVPADGNCLFTSLAHQLFGYRIGSKEMTRACKKLRADVVDHIKKNYASFEHEIKGRVFENIEKTEHLAEGSELEIQIDIEKETAFFINHLLPRNKYWGGSETLKAVSNLYDVNIILFNENDLCYIIHSFGKSHKKTIGVAFRAFNQPAEEQYCQKNHYDSVVDMASSDIYALVESLTTQNNSTA